MKALIAIALLFIAPVVRADSISTVATELKILVDVPFRYGVAQDLAGNLLTAQSLASYAGPVSLELSIESVVRAIGIDNTSYVGWATTDPITWLQSTIAIDPGASIGFSPTRLWFGEVGVVGTPEPDVLVLLSVVLVLGGFAAWRWLPRRRSAPPSIATEFGPVTEWARRQAAINMKYDAEKRKAVEELLTEKLGSAEKGLAEARRAYPECYEDEVK